MPRQSMPRAELAFARAVLDSRACHPVFSIAIQGHGEGLQATLASLASQAYQAFVVSVSGKSVPALAKSFPGLQDRILPVAKPGGTAAPAAEDPARPRLFMALRAGDTLGCDALLDLAVAFAADPGHGFIYADEYRTDPTQSRQAAFYKPDWSPELLLGMDYVGRPWCASQAVMTRAGLALSDLLTHSCYGLTLRLTEAAPRVRHINKVLAATHSATSAAERSRPLLKRPRAAA